MESNLIGPSVNDELTSQVLAAAKGKGNGGGGKSPKVEPYLTITMTAVFISS